MTHPEFLELARGMYRSLLNCIEGLHRQSAIVVEVIQSLQYVIRPFLYSEHSLNFLLDPRRLLWTFRLCKRN